MVKSFIVKTGLIFFLSFLQQSLYPQVIVPKVIPDQNFNVCWLISILHSLHPITSFREALKDFAAKRDKQSKNYSFNQRLNNFLMKLDDPGYITQQDFDLFKIDFDLLKIYPREIIQERDIIDAWSRLKPMFFDRDDNIFVPTNSKKPDAHQYWDLIFSFITYNKLENNYRIDRRDYSKIVPNLIYYPSCFVIKHTMKADEIKATVSTENNTANKKEINYELKSFVQGGTGHAVAYVRYGQNWYCYDTTLYSNNFSVPVEPKEIEDITLILQKNQPRNVLAFYSQVQPELEQKNDGQLSWLISLIRCLYSLNSFKMVLNNFTQVNKDHNSLEGLIQTAFNTFDEELSINPHQLNKIKEAMVARVNKPLWTDNFWKDQQINLGQFWSINLFSGMNFLKHDSNQECRKLFEYKMHGKNPTSQFSWKANEAESIPAYWRKQMKLLILSDMSNHKASTKPKLLDVHTLKSFIIKIFSGSYHSLAYIKYPESWYCYDIHAQSRKKIEDKAIEDILDISNKNNYLEGLFFYEQEDLLQRQLVNLLDGLKQLEKKLNQLKDKLADIRKKLNHTI